MLGIELSARNDELHEEPGRIGIRQCDALPTAQTKVAARRNVEAVGKREGVLLPREERHAVTDGTEQHG